MIVDCHAHYDPRMLDLGTMMAKMDAAGVDKVALIPVMNDPLPDTPDQLLAIIRWLMKSKAGRLAAEGTHRALFTAEGDLRLKGQVFQIYARPDNAAVAQVMAARPDRIYGWIFLNPRNNPGVLDELERWRSVSGMIGVKVHPHWHDYHTRILGPVLSRAEELGLPLLIHLGFRRRGDYCTIAQQHPRLKIICAHAGFPYYGQLWRHIRSYPNVYVDLSSPYLNETLVRDAVKSVGPHRCLYGTDSPYGFHDQDGTYDYGHIKGWIERLPVSAAEMDGILGGTFLDLVSP